MKLTFTGAITEVGCNYETNECQHSGCIIRVGEQNLHFELVGPQLAAVAAHLFQRVTLTVETPRAAKPRRKKP